MAQDLSKLKLDAIAGLQSHTFSEITEYTEIKPASRKGRVRRFDYPRPDTEQELATIQEESAELSNFVRGLAELGLEGAGVDRQITGLHRIAEHCQKLARNIGLHAVSEGNLSQIELSRALGVHELTVGRWVKAAQEQQATQEQGRPKQ